MFFLFLEKKKHLEEDDNLEPCELKKKQISSGTTKLNCKLLIILTFEITTLDHASKFN